jgi:hypothetical protein
MSGNGENGKKKYGPSGYARQQAAKTIRKKHAGTTAETIEKVNKFPNKGPKRKH